MKEEIERDELPLALRLTRIACGMSQAQLAKAVGYTGPAWNVLEMGKRKLEPKVAARVLRELRKGAPASPMLTLLFMECDRLIGGVR